MTRWYRDSGQLRRTILPTSVAMATVGIGVAAWAVAPYVSKGSDTLGDVAPDTISGSGANLTYQALGSGTAESMMLNGTQYVGFMSRNFKQTVLDGHSSWWPGPKNVLGLDAATVVVRESPTKIQNVVLPQNPDKQNFALPESVLSLALSGKGALGTAAACRAPERLAALTSISTDMAGTPLKHFYRRNDASGTSDTIRERVLTTASGTSGGRFCNGQAPGGVKDAVSGALFTNADAEDMDPIRKDCVEADDTHATTKCTYWPYNVACFVKNKISTASDPGSPVPAGIKCTQGFIVALTEVDPGSSDVTVSIANRVFNDSSGGTLGYAGREAVEQAGTTYGPTIERISNAALNVRLNAYPLSRRLFLNHGDPAADTGRQVEENKLYNWATGGSGRSHMQSIMSKWGFITCFDDPAVIPPGYNLCTDEDIPAAVTTMGLCTAEGKSCTAGTPCCDGSNCPATPNNTCPLAPALVDTPCASDNDCGTGMSCLNLGGASKVCRVPCTVDSDCASLVPAGQTCTGVSGSRKYCK